MNTNTPHDERGPQGSDSSLTPTTRENIEILTGHNDREEAQVSTLQALIERVSRFFGSPAYFTFALSFIVIWALVNGWGSHAGWTYVDKPPFFWLQGLVSSNALLLTVAVLIRQTRMERLAAHRAHLDLHINLLTEKKVAKLLEIIDEMRRAKSGPGTPTDLEAEELAKPADSQAILSAIKASTES